jgi:SAM-dependent methyltransferase
MEIDRTTCTKIERIEETIQICIEYFKELFKTVDMEKSKSDVQEFWNKFSCGEELYLKGESEKLAYINQSKKRFELEPYITSFADFTSSANKKILEIGAELFGIDLTSRAIENTQKRLDIFNLQSTLTLGDAENLTFENEVFDIVYSWGVIHHSPNTIKAISEIHRVLKNGGKAKIMIYHKASFVGYMLWIRYALLRLRPFTSLYSIYSQHLESPGTKAYTINEGYELFKKFNDVKITTVLSHGDLLTSEAGQRHKGGLLSFARIIWPRFIIRIIFPKYGLFMLIEASK